MVESREASSPFRDLIHPLPLGAAAVLFLNDHVLKGAGILPPLVTGKLSDFAGLFVFPIVIVSAVRGASAVPKRDYLESSTSAPGRGLVGGVVAIIGALFSAAKLVPSVNLWACDWWGPTVMDPTDLIALPSLVAAAFWMLRSRARSPSPSRPRFRVALAAFAALSCIATSRQAPPPKAAAPPARLLAKNAPCALIVPVTCRYDATRVVVRLSAKQLESASCSVGVMDVTVRSGSASAAVTLVDAGPFSLAPQDASLIGAYGRAGRAGETWDLASVRLSQHGTSAEGALELYQSIDVPCRPGFGTDTQPPSEVAQ